MKAALLRDISRRMEIEDVAIAQPQAHEVLVRIAAVGVCHSDLHVLDGSMPHPFPVVLGHEAAGIVEQVGAEVRHVRPGDHVVVCLAFHCGHCIQCQSGNSHRCLPPEAARPAKDTPRLICEEVPVTQFCNMGAFAELMLVHESGCVAIRKDMPLDRACLLGCAVATGFGAVSRSAGVRPGDTVAVVGCGGVGLSAIAAARLAGAAQVIAVDRLPVKLDMARNFGATDVVDASDGNAVAGVMSATGGRGVNHALEAIGRKDTIEMAFGMLAKGGTATVIGIAKPGDKIEIPALALLRETSLRGSNMGGVRTAIDIPYYVELYMQGRLPLDQLISQRLKLEQINEAFEDLRKGEVARSVIMFDV
jgi:S-(hydroxymethyl)glutathione dehydrogenase/alcohol dehydrogenase